MGATQVSAASIGPTCTTCQGSIYTLEIVGLADTDLYTDDHLFDTYVVKLTVDTAGYTGDGVRIDEVAVKVSSGADSSTLTSVKSLGSDTEYKDYWSVLAGGLGAFGCTGSGSGYECSNWIGSSGGAYIPSTFTWTFNIDISGPLFSFASSDPNLLPSIKVRYVDDDGKKTGSLVSEKVPEPTTLALLGVGMAVAAVRRRRAQR